MTWISTNGIFTPDNASLSATLVCVNAPAFMIIASTLSTLAWWMRSMSNPSWFDWKHEMETCFEVVERLVQWASSLDSTSARVSLP